MVRLVFKTSLPINGIAVFFMDLPESGEDCTVWHVKRRLAAKENFPVVGDVLTFVIDGVELPDSTDLARARVTGPIIVLGAVPELRIVTETVRSELILRWDPHMTVTQLAEALATMHRAGVRHQDIKPENVFLANLDMDAPGLDSGEDTTGPARILPVLLDLGVAAKDAELVLADGRTLQIAEAVQFDNEMSFGSSDEYIIHELQSYGVEVHVTDAMVFESFFTGLAMVKTAHDLWPKDFDWRREPYEYVADVLAINLLSGSADFRLMVEAGGNLENYREQYQADAQRFAQLAKSFFLY